MDRTDPASGRNEPMPETERRSVSGIMDSVIYNIPVDLVPNYRGRQIVVRILEPSEIVAALPDGDRENLKFIQLLSTDIGAEKLDAFADRGPEVPIDILVSDPVREYPRLYNFSKLLDTHPIRVSISVRSGFGKAVKLAAALNFAVKLVVDQPDDGLVEEMSEVLDMYLHRSSISQPIEYFHSMFLSSYREESASLWMIQEDDPDHFRFVSDEGDETFSLRFAGMDPASENPSNGSPECGSCEFKAKCGGYFKWPNPDYNCSGVKSLFATIDAAAKELRENVASMTAAHGGSR